jgi:hypothetical protein
MVKAVRNAPYGNETLSEIWGNKIGMRKLKPDSDVIARWNSVYRMICIVIANREVCILF